MRRNCGLLSALGNVHIACGHRRISGRRFFPPMPKSESGHNRIFLIRRVGVDGTLKYSGEQFTHVKKMRFR